MLQNVARLLLRACAFAFACIGTAFLVAPASMGGLVGLTLAGVDADNDVRAVYGGLQLACGALLWGAATRAEWLRAGLVAQVLLFSGLAAGRFVSQLTLGLPGPLGLALHTAELVAVAAGVVCLRALSRSHTGGAPPRS